MEFDKDRKALFPDIEPYERGRLAVDPPHDLYWEQSGNPDGAPILFIHGGPGAGATAAHRRFFDPTHYRIIIADQRGAGRSKPLGELTNNTTVHLIADMEALRERLEVLGGQVSSSRMQSRTLNVAGALFCGASSCAAERKSIGL